MNEELLCPRDAARIFGISVKILLGGGGKALSKRLGFQPVSSIILGARLKGYGGS
jgi:hypothetical protein